MPGDNDLILIQETAPALLLVPAQDIVTLQGGAEAVRLQATPEPLLVLQGGTELVTLIETGGGASSGSTPGFTEPLCWNGAILFWDGDALMIGVTY